MDTIMSLYEAPRHRRALRTRRLHLALRLAILTATLAAFVFLMLACLGPAPAHAQGRPQAAPYGAQTATLDPRLQKVREEYFRVRTATYWCAYDGTTAMVRAGATREYQVISFVARQCGPGMIAFLTAQGISESDATLAAAIVVNDGYEASVRMMLR